jgi:hypothetical protein
MLDVYSARAGEAEIRRNRRRTPPESEKGTTNWRRIDGPGVDSLQHVVEEDDAHPTVPLERRGEVGSIGAMERKARWCSQGREKKIIGIRGSGGAREEKRGEARV